LYGWGWNKFGQLGTGDTADRMEPALIQLPSRIIKVVCGSGFSIALTEDGYCYSWGGNGCGQCGQGHVTSVLVPQLISALVTKKVIEISSSTGCNHSLALCDDGSVFSWGCNTRGQLGLSTNDHESSPQQVPFITEEETIEQIYVGGNGNGSSFIVTENGDLFAFGWVCFCLRLMVRMKMDNWVLMII
jgi:alpha-tubulin suppressor-like RCC1 family protein